MDDRDTALERATVGGPRQGRARVENSAVGVGSRKVRELGRQSILACAMIGMLLGNGVFHAQAVSGTIVGTVTDPTGAVVPKAQVTIVLTGQSTAYTAVSNDSGNFTEPNLPPGVYSVSVTASGFRRNLAHNPSNSTSRQL